MAYPDFPHEPRMMNYNFEFSDYGRDPPRQKLLFKKRSKYINSHSLSSLLKRMQYAYFNASDTA